eukprot:1963765-Pyramimonas_sp.AAC.1
MDRGLVHNAQWCDARDMTARGHAKGRVDRALLLQVMDGNQPFKREVKKCMPYRGKNDTSPT